jgi:hypothetical protein
MTRIIDPPQAEQVGQALIGAADVRARLAISPREC